MPNCINWILMFNLQPFRCNSLNDFNINWKSGILLCNWWKIEPFALFRDLIQIWIENSKKKNGFKFFSTSNIQCTMIILIEFIENVNTDTSPVIDESKTTDEHQHKSTRMRQHSQRSQILTFHNRCSALWTNPEQLPFAATHAYREARARPHWLRLHIHRCRPSKRQTSLWNNRFVVLVLNTIFKVQRRTKLRRASHHRNRLKIRAKHIQYWRLNSSIGHTFFDLNMELYLDKLVRLNTQSDGRDKIARWVLKSFFRERDKD